MTIIVIILQPTDCTSFGAIIGYYDYKSYQLIGYVCWIFPFMQQLVLKH
jgi:hypothetical protein